MKRFLVLLAASLALLGTGAKAAQVFNDGEFTSWTFGSTAYNLATAAREASGGNPGARLSISTNTTSGTAYAYGIKSDYATSAALAGTAFTLTVDVAQGTGTVQAFELIVEQGGNVYRLSLGDTGIPSPLFATRTYNGTLNAASFTQIAGTGPPNPDFSGAATTRFGIGAGNSQSPTQVFFYDNVRLDLGAVQPTEPCAGFSDVIQGDSFCAATQWLKNRGVTSGCSATQYCPTLTVTRAQMALFMQRLGKALAPEVLYDARQYSTPVLAIDEFPGSLLCQTSDFATGAYGRNARFYGHIAAYPILQTIGIRAYLRYSTDGGQTWNYIGNWNVNQFPAGAVANPGQVAQTNVNAPPLNLALGTSYRFGLFADEQGANRGIQALVCHLEVTITTPP